MKLPESNGHESEADELPGAVAGRPSRPEIATSRLGTVLNGKYRLDAILGMGGMAVVYKATHRNKAEYAIKMLLPGHSMATEIRSRFLREGYAANSVRHAGAVRVLDDDVSEDGAAFLVLELLHGVACDKLNADCGGRLPVHAACAIALQTLEVLEAAHANGIIHRDIKPANLFVLRDGSIKVFDFGIARVRETMTGGAHTTGSGMLLGTPAFMAPEQALGKAKDVDLRVDVWATGATLFTLLSGAQVHEGDTPRDLLMRLITQPARSLAVVAPEVPRPIVEVVDRALDIDREGRWPTARAMRDALEAAMLRLWPEPPARAALAALVTSVVPFSAADVEAPIAIESKGSAGERDLVPATITREESGGRYGRPLRTGEETLRPVAREAQPLPRKRPALSLWMIIAVVGASFVTVGVFLLRGQKSSHEAPRDVAPQPATAAQSVARSTPAQSPTQTSAQAEPPATPSSPASTERAGASPAPSVVTPAPDRPPPAPVPPAQSAPSSPAAGVATKSGAPARRETGAASPPMKARSPSEKVVSPPSRSRSPSPSSASPSEPPSVAPNCNPPFYYDSAFNRVFKKECL